MDLETRIEQFEHMCREDADNDMAWFSLANAYNQAGRFKEAGEAYLRCIDLNAAMSKAYQMAGAALMASGDTDRAAEVLTKGYSEAASRGDLMPKEAMKDLLVQLGQPIPAVAEQAGTSGGSFVCQRTGRAGTQMERAPFKGPVGAWIRENISAETWRDWIGQGTKVINELRLDLSRDEDGETYDRYMREYLGIDEELYARLMGG
jgi:Fe-S cluster biosynthesis and repair protein YggX